nr:EOG090X0HUX [Moina brachiata]
MSSQRLQLTLAILKPDIVKVPCYLKEVRRKMLSAGFSFVRSKEICLKQSDAERFYYEHNKRFFYNRLITFMSSGPIHIHIIAHNNAIKHWRDLMGPTKTFIAQYQAPDSLRGSFGLTDTRNSMHGSDSETSALKEISFFFPSFDYSEWLSREEPLLRQGKCFFNSRTLCHETQPDIYLVNQQQLRQFR